MKMRNENRDMGSTVDVCDTSQHEKNQPLNTWFSRLSRSVVLFAVASILSGCGLGGAMAAMQEDPSIELSLDRIGAAHSASDHADHLLKKTALGNSSWPSDLYDINKQVEGIRAKIRKRGPHNPVPAQLGIIPPKSYIVTNARVFDDFTGAQRDKIGKGKGMHKSVIHAFGAIYGEKGAPVIASLDAVEKAIGDLKKAQDALAEAEARLEAVESEEDTEQDTIRESKGEIEKAGDGVDAAEDALASAEKETIRHIEACGGAPIDASQTDLAQDVLRVVNYLMYLYNANADAAAMVLVQIPRAAPNIMDELKHMAIRLVIEAAQDAGDEMFGGISVTIALDENNDLSLELVGAPESLNATSIQRIVLSRVTDVFTQMISAPGQTISLMSKASSRSNIMESMVTSLEASTGTKLGPFAW